MSMSATGTLPRPYSPGILLPWMRALLAAFATLTGAAVGIMTSFDVVHWTPAQTTLVGAEATAFWVCAGAVVAHFCPRTKKQPVAVAGTVTALVSATL